MNDRRKKIWKKLYVDGIFRIIPALILFLFISFFHSIHSTAKTAAGLKQDRIVALPLDGRNQTYDYIQYIIRICGFVPVVPPREIMGNISEHEDAFKKQWNAWYWLNRNLDKKTRLLIVSADSLVYGGLLESREDDVSIKKALNNLKLLEIIRKRHPRLEIMVFTSIPRKEAKNRPRNMTINIQLIKYVHEGVINFLSISGDDVTDIANQVKDIARMKDFIEKTGVGEKVIISSVDRIILGIDESAMVLFTRWLNHRKNRNLKVFVLYRDIAAARVTNDHYSATPVMSVAIDMVEAVGGKAVYEPGEADLILAVNHSSGKVTDKSFASKIKGFLQKKPVTVGDLSSRNHQAEFFRELYKQGIFPELAGYANWGMGTNTLGTALCQGCASLRCPDEKAYMARTAFLYERLVSDYIYLDNIHLQMAQKIGIPAYSRMRMSDDREKEAVRFVNEKIGRNLHELGIKYSIPGMGESSETHCKGAKDTKDVDYIPLSPGETDIPETEKMVFKFKVQLPANPYGKMAEIIVGPVSFPFHRLFEVSIPVKAEIGD